MWNNQTMESMLLSQIVRTWCRSWFEIKTYDYACSNESEAFGEHQPVVQTYRLPRSFGRWRWCHGWICRSKHNPTSAKAKLGAQRNRIFSNRLQLIHSIKFWNKKSIDATRNAKIDAVVDWYWKTWAVVKSNVL